MNKTTVGVLLIALIAVGAGIWINQHRQQNPEQAAGNAPLILPPQEPVPPAAATADRTPKNPADAPAPRAAAPEPSAPQPSAAAGLDWNRRNPDALSNGNLEVAANYLRNGGRADGRIRADARAVLSRPADYYGQTLCFSGRTAAYDDDASGNLSSVLRARDTSEVVLRHADGSVLDFYLIGAPRVEPKPGQQTALCGLPVGTVDTSERGHKTEQLVLVGKLNT